MTREINLGFFLTVLKKAWWKILLIVLAVSIVTFLFSSFFLPKKYKQELQFYAINNSSESEFTNTGLVEAAIMLAQDYIRIINSDVSLEAIVEKASEKGYDLTEAEVSAMISSQAVAESATFYIYVTDEDPKLAYDIANIIKETAPDIIKSISKPVTTATTEIANETTCVTIMSNPAYHENPSSPNVEKNTMFAALIALIGSYIIFFAIALLDITIRTKDDVKKNTKVPLIGTIPTWELNSNSKGGVTK